MERPGSRRLLHDADRSVSGEPEALEQAREPVPLVTAAGGCFVDDPVELDRPSDAVVGFVSVPGVVPAAEGNEGAVSGDDLVDDVLDVVSGAEEAEPSAFGIPVGVEVDKDGDELRLAVEMDLAVLQPGAAADGECGGRPSRSMPKYSPKMSRTSGERSSCAIWSNAGP